MRPDAATTVAYLHREGVEVKIISGDGPATVAAVARAAGIETEGRVTTGAELPRRPRRCAGARSTTRSSLACSPSDKRQLVAALRRGGRRVGMVSDGVNDVPALKECDVAVALGSGSQLAKGVADVVLVSESFEAIPFAIEEGRKILRNVQRVAKLFVAKSVFAAVLILTVGVGRRLVSVPAAPALARGCDHGRHPGLLHSHSRPLPRRRRARSCGTSPHSRSRPGSFSASRCCSGTASCTRRSGAPPRNRRRRR